MNKLKKQYKEDKLFIDIARRFAKESHCESKKVAALAVKNGRIIATGINGTLHKEINCDEYFKLYYKTKKIKVSYKDWKKTKEWRELHHEWSLQNEIHSEENLISELCRNKNYVENIKIYITLSPCHECVKKFATLGVSEIIYLEKYDKMKYNNFYLLQNRNIILRQFKYKEKKMNKCKICEFGAIYIDRGVLYEFKEVIKKKNNDIITINYDNGDNGCRKYEWNKKEDKCIKNNFSEFKKSEHV